jgi:transcriptional regulator
VYPIETFHVTDLAEIRAFVDKYPFATLVATDANGELAATHVPLLVQSWGEQIVFRGHVMRDSDHWRALQHSQKVFVSFLGPDAPVLGSWQLTPAFGGTWNYQAVHVRGVVKPQDGETLLRHLQELKDRFESSPGHKFDSLPSEYIEALVPRIECIDVHVTKLECIFKLSQNRRVEEFDSTVEHLKREGGKAALVAAEMEARRAVYYPRP